ncbi:MAG: hypothetical protein GXX91_12650, partial [Verrucomicrobiaceae bacterium]|nr:hypothetical protein [Verrucomicrobiaceae bacterium]
MSEETPVENPKKIRRSPRGILRWLARFVGLSAVVVSGILIVVAVLSSIAYLNRARIVNKTLALLVEPFHVRVGEIDFHRFGEVRITDLQLTPKNATSDRVLAFVPEVRITYRLDDLRHSHKLRGIDLRGASVHLDDSLVAALSRPASEVGENAAATRETDEKEATEEALESTPFDLNRLAFFTNTFSIRDSHLTLDLEGWPRLETDWHFHTAGLEFDESGLNREAIHLRLENIRIGAEGKNGRIDRLIAAARVRSDLSHFHFTTLHLLRPQLRLTPDLLPASAEKPAAQAQEGRVADPTESDGEPESALPELVIEALRVDDATVAAAGFDGTDGGPAFPDLSLSTSFAFADISFHQGIWRSGAPLSLGISDLSLGKGNAQFLAVERLHLVLDELGDLVHRRTLSSLHLQGLDVFVGDPSLAPFRGEKAGGRTEPDAVSDAEPAPELPWTLEKLTLTDGTVLVQDLVIGETTAPYFEARIEAGLERLQFGREGFRSDGSQSITLEQAKLRAPAADLAADPLLSIEYAELGGKWSDFQRDGLIERLLIRGPQIHFTDKTLGAWLHPTPASDEDKPAPPSRPVYKVARLDVTGGRLVADSSFAVGKVPKIYSDFSLRSDPSDEGDPYAYRLQLDDFQVRNHPRYIESAGPPAPPALLPQVPSASASASTGITPVNEDDVFSVKTIELDFTAEQLQRTRRIGKLKMSGAVLTVGEGLKAIADVGKNDDDDDDEAPEEPPPAPPSPADPAAPQARAQAVPTLPVWLIEEVEITQSQVRFETLIPQVEGLHFAIETRLHEVPLSLDGLLAEEKLQKVELSGIEIKDPYNSFITVAFLPTIFVEFSLAGLARQEIENIDLIAPSLHVGQGLFWWIDYQRNFREQNEGASVGIEAGVETAGKPDWVIKTINATAGKIVIAPTGIPIGIVPFPFNATTSMSGGNIELKLTIPDEDHVYRFPDYKVDLYGLAGNVQFNVPVQTVDNNLVQTFTLKRAVWKEHEARDLYISVTFDSDGIYGQFGGASYDGYAEGQFNFYLSDPGKWDA